VRFALGAAAPVSAEVVDVAGRRVAELLDAAPLAAGVHVLPWKPSAPGTYFIRVRAGTEEAATKITAIR
jgi:hypothetical protein